MDDLPPAMAKKADLGILMVQGIAKQFTLADLEREYIGKVLESTQGNKTEAAKLLGVDRTTLYRKLEEYKIKDVNHIVDHAEFSPEITLRNII